MAREPTARTLTMLRIEVSEEGEGGLPAIDVDDAVVIIGSGTAARIRLPAGAVEREHVRIEGNRWRAIGAVAVGGAAKDAGEIGDGVTLELGGYRVRIAPAPAGAVAAPVQRTESLARELMRNLMGGGEQPSLTIERGPAAGATRLLAPPESTLVIGRGDEADWILDDKDLSRVHAEVRRGWDGTRIVDLDSKNGTKVDGDRVTGDGMALRDGCVVEIGPVVMRFRDPAEKYLQGDAPAFRPVAAAQAKRAPAVAPAPPAPMPRASTLPFYAALSIMLAALAMLVWIVSS
jgi:hypothetical protein